MWKLFYFLGSLNILGSSLAVVTLTTVYEWTQLEFDYPNPQDRQNAINNNEFDVGNILPIDVQPDYSPRSNHIGRVFVTVPRFQSGVPVTLGTVYNKTFQGNPVITPYPSWDWHTNPEKCKPNRLVSVFRVHIDHCGRLWVVDTGKILDNATCPPQIIAFDLKNGNVVDRFEIPNNLLRNTSLLVNLAVENAPLCFGSTFVFVGDNQAKGLIVYHANQKKAWRIEDQSLDADPKFENFTQDGFQFQLLDGILAMALKETRRPNNRLFFHPLSSDREYEVYVRDLIYNYNQPGRNIFRSLPLRKHVQSGATALDSENFYYFGVVNSNKIYSWNSGRPFISKNIKIFSNDENTLKFLSGLKIVREFYMYEQIWALTSQFGRYMNGQLNTTQINFRIQMANIPYR